MFHSAEESVVGSPEALFKQWAKKDAQEDEGTEGDGLSTGVAGTDSVTRVTW